MLAALTIVGIGHCTIMEDFVTPNPGLHLGTFGHGRQRFSASVRGLIAEFCYSLAGGSNDGNKSFSLNIGALFIVLGSFHAVKDDCRQCLF